MLGKNLYECIPSVLKETGLNAVLLFDTGNYSFIHQLV
jgi:hypothetical protein